jgi:signal transduction histidine kinase
VTPNGIVIGTLCVFDTVPRQLTDDQERAIVARLGGRLARAEVDLAAVLAEVSEDLTVALAGASLTAGPLPVVTGDPVQLRAVVQNLVANAAKFVQPGVAPKIAVSAARVAGGWRIEVADHGIGIRIEHRERVFEPLARIDQRLPGCGIGLATVRRVIDAHGGRIGLAETPGGGTTAWFELPD